jgi:two-component system OmpR family sensor kinase
MSRPRVLRRFHRLPIRVRLTVAFAVVMAAVLAGAGVFLFVQIRSDLDAQIDIALHLQAANVVRLVEQGEPQTINSTGSGLAQVYGAGGRLLFSTRAAAGSRLLTPAEAARATSGPYRIEHRALASGSARVLALPARAPNGQPVAVAVAMPLGLRDHEIDHLQTLLLIAGPLALLLASLAGYELARAALRSMERMRTQAEQITEHELSERLTAPEAQDEIAALAHTLNAMLDRLEAAVARDRRVVSDASHELRTPLTTLRAELDLALMGERDASELRAALQSASDEARRMSRLADDLLVLARADQGRLPLNPKPLVVREVLERVASHARAAAAMRGRSIVIANVPDSARVRADPDRTAQALENLITNALQYGDGTITLTARNGGRLIELHVTDEGPGFPDQFIDRAFERFARGDGAALSAPGSGLGLSLVQAIAAAHGGRANARNRPGRGADVWIALPRG